MDERRIATMSRITLVVQNMMMVTEFYRDVLQLKPIFDLQVQPPQWIEFNTGPCRLALQVASRVDGVPPPTARSSSTSTMSRRPARSSWSEALPWARSRTTDASNTAKARTRKATSSKYRTGRPRRR